MTNRRRPIQQAHERFTVSLFLDALNRRHRSQFQVISEPNPPEAIIQSNKTIRWVEVTTAFWSKDFAIDQYSYVTEGEKHKPIGDGVIVGPDAKFATQFVGVVRQKLEKQTYEAICDQYGPGYLVVSIQYPLYNPGTPRFMQRAWAKLSIADRNCFRSIYLIYRVISGYKVILWRPQ